MRVALLSNPESGSGGAGEVGAALSRHGAEVSSFALDEIDEAAASSVERVVVAGGDGSLGCGAAAAARAAVPLAVIPVGTANDFARAMALPDDLEEAARLAAKGTRTRPVELAWMGSRPFLNVASFGLPPAAAVHAHGWKGVLGRAAYAFGALRAGMSSDPIPCLVKCDARPLYEGEAWQVTVAASGAFGGGAEVDTEHNDGLLDVVVFEAGSRATLALRAYGLRRGTVETQRGVHTCRAQTVELEVADGTPFNVDGEVVSAGPVRFEARRGVTELVVG